MKRLKPKIALGIVVALLLSNLLGLTGLANPAYDGSASSWALPEINDAQANELLFPGILSDFQKPITREEFCVIAVRLYERLSGNVVEPGPSPFSDTAHPEVIKANMLGIVLGTGEGKFTPHNNITRQELCVMIYLALGKALPNMSTEIEKPQRPVDEQIIAAWAKEAVAFCVDRSIVKGVGDGRVDPLRNTTREESIAIINRTFEGHKEGGHSQPPIADRRKLYELAKRMKLTPTENVVIKDIIAVDKLRPSVRLSDDRIYYVQPSSEPIFHPQMPEFHKTDMASILAQAKLLPPAATVDLRKYQTPIKNQGGRNTCVSHAVCAAIEAAYKRYDPVKYGNLDLSEQFTHQMDKSQALKSAPLSNARSRENAMGRWGFANMHHMVALYSRLFGIPEEKYMPYIGDESYEEKPRDSVGLLDPDDPTLLQRRVNNMNLSLDNLPIDALTNAKYGIKKWGEISGAGLKDLDQYRAVLKTGHEIMFTMHLMKPDPTPDDNVWDPGVKYAEGLHAMLMVGYDDDREVFIVKNSWGYANIYEDGYTLISYDWVTKGHVPAAIFILEIDQTPSSSSRPSMKPLGQWKLVSNGGPSGQLDISHIPGFYHEDFGPMDESFGQADNRIGLYTWGNQPHQVQRVNGRILGGFVRFWLHYDEKLALDYSTFEGILHTGRVFDKDPTLMAGYYENTEGEKFGFYATKDKHLISVPNSTGTTIYTADFTGTWELNHNGEIGTLILRQPTSNTAAMLAGILTGTYKSGSSTVDVTGSVKGNKLTLEIPFPNNHTQKFEGYMHALDKGIISGQNQYQNGLMFGWIARRTGDAKIEIVNPLPRDDTIIIPDLPFKPGD